MNYHFRRGSFAFMVALTLAFALATTLVSATAAGGTLSGIVTDPKGAAIVGAGVRLTDTISNQTFTAVTDAQGRYKIEGLPASLYTAIASANGFADARRENLRVEENSALTFDARLEVATLETEAVTIKATGSVKANADPVYTQLRRQMSDASGFTSTVATVNNLVLKRDEATFTLRSGQLFFLTPVEGRATGAVFIGDGDFTLTPPTENEKRSLALFADAPTLTETFTQLVLRFTDNTLDEVKASSNATTTDAAASTGNLNRARDIFRANQNFLRKRLQFNIEMRTLLDLYATARPGFFIAFIDGKRFDDLIYTVDPLGIPRVSPEQVALSSTGETTRGVWASFHTQEARRQGQATSNADRRLFDITHHEIDGQIRGTNISAVDTLTLEPLVAGVRVLPFALYGSLRVGRVQDEQGRDLNFIQEAKDEDSDLAVILPGAPAVKKPLKLTFIYAGGDALRDSGGGNFILLPAARATWHPNNGGTQFGEDRATFDTTFRHPKGLTFIGTGAPAAPEAREGDIVISKWTSGKTELTVSGFNYGRFVKKDLIDQETGYGIEFYANKEVPNEIREMQMNIERAEAAGVKTMTTLGNISTASMGSAAIADTQNAARIYNAFFGKLPYTRIAMSQQPAAFFGQAWPTLVYMPYTAYINTTQRVQMFGIRGGTDNFWRYVGPHEVAHQWWGHIIGWSSYRDQWMSEGFAEFSASLYVQFARRDIEKFIDFWEDQRQRIITATPATKGKRPYTVGAVTQGFRLSSAKTGGAYQMVYPKGAYILHMLRMMMHDPREGGDRKFQLMMRDFVQTHYNQDVSTEDFKAAVEKHITPAMNLGNDGKMDWFFNQYVYGTEMPSYKFDYRMDGTKLSGQITQSGVSDNFRMLVPIYVDLGKGWQRLGSATITGNKAIDLSGIELGQKPKRVAICALNDVLAVEVQNNKR